jgi:hypothetical protein
MPALEVIAEVRLPDVYLFGIRAPWAKVRGKAHRYRGPVQHPLRVGPVEFAVSDGYITASLAGVTLYHERMRFCADCVARDCNQVVGCVSGERSGIRYSIKVIDPDLAG